VALKACGRGLAHKSDIGAVALGLATETAVRHAYAQIRERVAAHRLKAEGVLVSPMRAGGVELLAGVTVDPTFGPVLAVGIGGIWVETYRDVALRLIPVDPGTVEAMLTELKGAALLRGAHGGQAVDVKHVVDAVIRLTDAARALGPTLEALEVNPLWCSSDRIEALDVRVVTKRKEV
jgi:hypothetical protein